MRIRRLAVTLAVAVATALLPFVSADAAPGNPVSMTDGFYADPDLQGRGVGPVPLRRRARRTDQDRRRRRPPGEVVRRVER
nr:hypothetical protein GCM10020241_18930 [Streptoalloteichus tenebrarius]